MTFLKSSRVTLFSTTAKIKELYRVGSSMGRRRRMFTAAPLGVSSQQGGGK